MTATATRRQSKKLVAIVDKLGDLNARIARLTKEADAMKAELKGSGLTEIAGTTFRAVISTRTTARLDSALVRSILTPRQVDACTVESTSTSISLYDL